MDKSNLWIVFSVCAGLAWGTYVPLVAYGGRELGNSRFGALLCVSIAYVILGVILPLALFGFNVEPLPKQSATGSVFATLAGAAGAIGALCVIFATRAAGGPRAKEALFIAPIIFSLAPLINTILSALWHPKAGDPWVFHLEMPGWKLWAGIVLIGIGAALVLYSKEETEQTHVKPPAQTRPPEVAQR